jgi:hypothetical protein
MGLLDRLLGKSKSGGTKDAASHSEPPTQRAYQIIFQAEGAWRSRNVQLAEDLFLRGIREYRSTEPDGLDFALGRYGAFLLDRGRNNEAATILEDAIASGANRKD